MSRLRALPVGAWIAISLLGAAILVPASAVATTSLVGLVGPNGVRAGVTNASQLRTAEAAPGTFMVFNRNGLVPGPGNCQPLTSDVGTRGYVIKQVVFNVFVDTNPGQGEVMALHRASGSGNQSLSHRTHDQLHASERCTPASSAR